MATNQLYQDNFPHMTPAWSRIFNFVADRAEGSYIYTDDGKKLLDFTSGIGVTNTGHCHPESRRSDPRTGWLVPARAGEYRCPQADAAIDRRTSQNCPAFD